MNLLTVILFLSCSGERHGAGPAAKVTDREMLRDRRPGVILIADGSDGWVGQTANAIIGEITASLGANHVLQVVRFDAEPVLQNEACMRGSDLDSFFIRPRTPMRDTMEAAFARRLDAPGPRTVVVIAHEQFYPSSVSTDRLLDLARRSEATVHTIHLSSTRETSGVSRKVRRSLSNGIVWLVETLGMQERGYSARDTARLLKIMADATGGTSCETNGELTWTHCARTVAAEIAIHTSYFGPSRAVQKACNYEVSPN
jgi:hypothetical protein